MTGDGAFPLGSAAAPPSDGTSAGPPLRPSSGGGSGTEGGRAFLTKPLPVLPGAGGTQNMPMSVDTAALPAPSLEP